MYSRPRLKSEIWRDQRVGPRRLYFCWIFLGIRNEIHNISQTPYTYNLKHYYSGANEKIYITLLMVLLKWLKECRYIAKNVSPVIAPSIVWRANWSRHYLVPPNKKMAKFGDGVKFQIPDWRQYKVQGCPELETVQRQLAAKGLKDPWLR